MMVAGKDDCQQVVVTLGNDDGGLKVSYEMRGLLDEEIGSWAQFCASIFAYKTNPPPASYFERHYYKDPDRLAFLVRVIFDSQGNMVASCRVFRRTLSTGANSAGAGAANFLNMGGIGEVCTHESHRRRGLSKHLLQDAIRIMKEMKLDGSFLHAAPEFFTVYEKSGYHACARCHWSIVGVKRRLDSTPSPDSIRPASFPSDTKEFMRIHQQFSEQHFAGCIIRSKDYWNTYLSEELKGSLWVYHQRGTGKNNDELVIVAWISLRSRGEVIQVREFGCDVAQISVAKVFPLLLQHAMSKIDLTGPQLLQSSSDHQVKMPTFLVKEVRKHSSSTEEDSYMDFSSDTKDDDDLGWMYKALGDNDDILAIVKDQPHWIWPADSF